MKKPERKTSRDRFEENYIPVRYTDPRSNREKIRYLYYGPWYLYQSGEGDGARIRLFCGAAYLMALVLFCGAAVLPVELNREWPAIGLGGLVLCCFIMEFMPLVKLMYASGRITRITYEDTEKGIQFFAVARILFAIAGGVWGTVRAAALHASALAVLVPAAFFLVGGLAFAEVKSYGRLGFTTEENDTLKRLEKGELTIRAGEEEVPAESVEPVLRAVLREKQEEKPRD